MNRNQEGVIEGFSPGEKRFKFQSLGFLGQVKREKGQDF
jgi:hypothetical protein